MIGLIIARKKFIACLALQCLINSSDRKSGVLQPPHEFDIMELLLPLPSGFPPPKRPKDRLKLALGALLYPRQTRRWQEFLRAHPQLDELAQFYPLLRHKIYRPYLSTQLDCSDRVNVLIGHYRLMFQSGFGNFIREAAVHPVTLCRFFGKSATPMALQISAVREGHREGEFCLRLIKEGECLYAVTFLLVVTNNTASIQIGCLQGLKSADGNSIMKALTRDLFGCRPKNFMVSLVREIGQFFGCQSIYLTSNSNRVSINPWRRRRISSDYDEIWRDMGALPRANGDFELPCTPFQASEIENLPSKKRSEARKRNELLVSICAVVQQRLEAQRIKPLAIETAVSPAYSRL